MTTINEINDKIEHMKTIYHKIYKQQTDDIKRYGKSSWVDCPEEKQGFYNGGFMKYEEDGYFYYLYENLIFTSILKRNIEIDNDLYLNNAYEFNTGTYTHLDDDINEELLTHYIDEYGYYKYKKLNYDPYFGSVLKN